MRTLIFKVDKDDEDENRLFLESHASLRELFMILTIVTQNLEDQGIDKDTILKALALLVDSNLYEREPLENIPYHKSSSDTLN